MFNFGRWKKWLEAKAQEMPEFGAEFNLGKHSSKPGYAFAIRTNEALSQIRIWNTGEADYDVMSLSSKEFIIQRSGLHLDDESFESAFEDFLLQALGASSSRHM
jgi:hypothetical protein